MKRALAVGPLVGPLLALAQPSSPGRLETCRDNVVASTEHYSLGGGIRGGGQAADMTACGGTSSVYAAGAATYSVDTSRWTIGRAAGSWSPRDDLWLALEGAGGSGRTGGERFGYTTLRGSVTTRFAGRWFAKLQDDYIDIDKDRGNVLRTSLSALALKSLLLEAAASRSIDGNLRSHGYAARVDWVDPLLRAYAGGASGRVAPRAVDIIAGNRATDQVTREWFGGVALPAWRGEIQLAFDFQSTTSSARRTVALAVRWPLP